jgi:predicted transcriptional regulator
MTIDPDKLNFVARVWRNDSTRKGLAAAAAGVLIGVISEAIWPSA